MLHSVSLQTVRSVKISVLPVEALKKMTVFSRKLVY